LSYFDTISVILHWLSAPWRHVSIFYLQLCKRGTSSKGSLWSDRET